VRRRHLDAVFLIHDLEETLLALTFWIQLACTFPQGPSGTSILLFTAILRPVPLQDVSGANAVFMKFDIFNKDCILLTRIS
jgi:hypothetical protein